MSVPANGPQDTGLATEAMVAISLLRSGPNTSAARLFKELMASGSPTIRGLAERLGLPPGRRATEIRWAADQARKVLADAMRLGQSALSCRAEAYPDRLRHIPDPPIILWLRGQTELLDAPAVAIVGSRSATPAGLSVATRLGRELADVGLVVVSGMARGVDAAAHRGAIDGTGRTIAVLGCGTDVIYPREHHALARQILARGAIVSELPPGTPPRQWHFPLRNRIISGLAQAVVVVEASEKSGSLITAKAALEQGRDVLAVPGNVISGRHRGCHALIKDGARLVETVDDVLEELRWSRRFVQVPPALNSLQLSELEGTMAAGEPYSVDELAEATGRPAPDLLAELGALEVAGRVSRLPGGVFVRT
ncbi:MAG TPA: DNA-processing protein DprA [Vicinamibacterales bacterium]|nr:DNA-processing protein DprA [Vicinamibacterales bacterium]